jgi:predicted P-loop ATPase/GTPase
MAALRKSCLFVVIMKWINIFIHSLVLISAGILVILDTQISGINGWQSFGILLMISEVGLGLGCTVYLFIKKSS